ncbi:MAG: CHC2 zinc finger domain-containing protein [Nitrospinota bacterium]
MEIQTRFIKPDILNILIKEGIELNQRGKYFWSLCPLHSEKTPSFKVDSEKQTFFCWGCNTGGDIITFIQKLKGYPFKDACRYLGITTGKPPKSNTRELKKREAFNKFKQWCNEYYNSLSDFYRLWQDVKENIKTIEDAERFSRFYHAEPVIVYYMDIFHSRDEEAKFKLFKAVNYGN